MTFILTVRNIKTF